MQRFRGGLVFKAHRLCVSLNSRIESNKEEEEEGSCREGLGGCEGVEVRGAVAVGAGVGVQGYLAHKKTPQ